MSDHPNYGPPAGENRTMNLIKLPELSLIETLNQTTDYFNQPLNESTKEDKELYHFYKKEQLIFLVTLLVLIIAGNSLVLLTLACNKRRKPRMNYFIKHLAYSDLLVGLVSVSVDISWKITLSFNAGNLLCKLVKYGQELVIYASTYVLVMLSLDRYDAVINPLNFNTRTNRAKHMVFIAWLLSGLLSVPALFLNQIRIKSNLPQCWLTLSPTEWKIYFSLVSLSLFFIPMLIILYCYCCIIRTIWFDQRRTEQAATPNDRCAKETAPAFASKELDFLGQEQLLAKEQLLSEHQLSADERFVGDQFTNSTDPKQLMNEGVQTADQDAFEQSNIHTIKPELAKFRDRLSLKLNSITQSSMWPDALGSGHKLVVDRLNNSDRLNSERLNGDRLNSDKLNGDKLNNGAVDKHTDKFANFNDSFNSSPIDKTAAAAARFSGGRRLFNSRSILQKHHSFDQAFDHSFDRIRINPKLNCIKEQTRPELTTSSLKIDPLPIKKNSCMRVNSQGIIPKARIKTLQMTFVIITVFIFCWSPYIIWDLLQVYGYIKRSAATNAIATFIQSLAPLNSAANPLIFCFFSSKEVFQTIKLIWSRLCFRRSKKSKLEQINNRSLTNTTIRKPSSSPTTTTSACTTNTKSTTLSRSKSTEN